MTGRPTERPIDRQRYLVLSRGSDHPICLRHGSRKRLFYQNMCSIRGDGFDVFCMLRRGGAQDHKIRLGGFHTVIEPGENAIRRNVKISDRGLHPSRGLITDSGNLGAWMLEHHPEQVPHVHVVEVNADNLQFHIR